MPCGGDAFQPREIPQYTDDSGVPAYYVLFTKPSCFGCARSAANGGKCEGGEDV